jgi:hypothetical protein
MRDQEKYPLLTELASIVKKRNLIDRQRTRARCKASYYRVIKENVNAWNLQSSSLSTMKQRLKWEVIPVLRRNLERDIVIKQNELKAQRRLPCPKKWLKKTRELNMLILKYEAEAAQARYEIAKLTCNTNARVRYINKQLSSCLNYDNGQVQAIIVPSNNANDCDWLHSEEIERLANEHEGIKVVEDMLEGKFDQVQ